MRPSRKLVAIVVIANLFCVAFLAAAPKTRTKAKRQQQNAVISGVPEMKNQEVGAAQADEIQVEKPEHFKVLVHEDAEDLHKKIGKALETRNLVPPHRAIHFAWIAQHRQLEVNWRARIENITPIPGGHEVTLDIRPSLTLGGSPALTTDHSYEKYRIVNGAVHFIEGSDPENALPGISSTL